MWLLGSGKRSVLLTRMEWKEQAQSRSSTRGIPVPMPPTLTPSQQRGGLMSEEAHGSGWLRPPISPSIGGCFGRGIWALAGLGRPLAARAAAHRCLRSACWSLRERSSMRTFLSWSRCSKRLTFICRTWTAAQRSSPAAGCLCPRPCRPQAPCTFQCVLTCTVSCEANSSCSFSAIWRTKLGSPCSAWLYPGGRGAGSRPALGCNAA